MIDKELLLRIEEAQRKIISFRPLSDFAAKQLRDYYRIGLTYSSNALEGNSLTETETKVVLEDGLTIGGKTVREHAEAIGHSRAYDLIYDLSAEPSDITEAHIKEIHRIFVHIHPFVDGNGRVGRLLMNTALLQYGYPITIIPPVLRSDYIQALRQSNDRNNNNFTNLIARCVHESQKDYLRLVEALQE